MGVLVCSKVPAMELTQLGSGPEDIDGMISGDAWSSTLPVVFGWHAHVRINKGSGDSGQYFRDGVDIPR